MPGILIIDDDPFYLRVWEKVLRDINATIHIAQADDVTVEQALASGEIDLVISDIVMGNGNGYEVAQHTHAVCPEAAILLTTAFESNPQNFDAAETPIHVLYKPYQSIQDIQLLVRNLLNHEEPSLDLSEDSFSENEHVPTVTEWRL
jgi:DNA-binding NtrC family response regulator